MGEHSIQSTQSFWLLVFDECELTMFPPRIAECWNPHRLSFPRAHQGSCSLDTVPHDYVAKAIGRFKSSLGQGCRGTIEFSALAPGIRFMSRAYIQSTLPFLPRRFTRSLDRKTAIPERSSTPLFITLNQIVELLISPAHADPLILESITNASSAYARSIAAAYDSLSNSRYARDPFIQEFGITAWREYRFFLAWEAALLKTGKLERWVVMVQRN